MEDINLNFKNKMIIYEDFIVKVPSISGFLPGDIVSLNIDVCLRQGFALRNGLVVKVDTDPDQDLLPIFFVIGLQTNIRLPLQLGSLKRCGRLTSKL